MVEKVSIELSKKTLELLKSNKEKNESIDSFLLRLLSYVNEEDIERKILFIGPPAAGKSTIRKIFFENESPDILIEKPLEPTRGIENYTYNWLDVSAGIADSAGQEIERWLGLDQEIAFGESDSIVFIFDVSIFEKNKEQILEDLLETLNSKSLVAPKSQFSIFLHKIDLLPEDNRDELLDNIKSEITEYLKSKDHKSDAILVKYYYTSIKGKLILNLIKSMRAILYAYSKIMRRALVPYSMRL